MLTQNNRQLKSLVIFLFVNKGKASWKYYFQLNASKYTKITCCCSWDQTRTFMFSVWTLFLIAPPRSRFFELYSQLIECAKFSLTVNERAAWIYNLETLDNACWNNEIKWEARFQICNSNVLHVLRVFLISNVSNLPYSSTSAWHQKPSANSNTRWRPLQYCWRKLRQFRLWRFWFIRRDWASCISERTAPNAS